MLRVLDCITTEHDLRLVVVAGIVCMFACFTALNLLDRARFGTDRARLWWLTGSAAVFGCGVWATHFVAMLAFGQSVPMGYDIGLTVLSIAIAVAISWAGFAVSLRGGGMMLIGGAIAGAAVGSMHFVGMAAMFVPATVEWDAAYVVASITIGIALGAAALRVGLTKTETLTHRFGGMTLLTLAIVGLHFTAMAAVSLTFDPTISIPQEIIEPQWLAVAIAAVTLLIIGLGLVGSIFDQHLADRSVREAEQLRRHVAELEATRLELEQTAANLTKALEAAAASSQAKSQFLATMSHELRTPLNAVIGFSDLIASQVFGPLGNPRYVDYAKSICDSGAHLLGLINDVLDISKLDAGRLQLEEREIALEGVAGDAVRMIAPQAEIASVRVEKQFESDLPRIKADERRVRQVILNLLSNAVKFTPKDGTVSVTVFRQNGSLVVTVSDTGIGIAERDIPRALERFGQVDDSLGRKYEGTGLGLPLSKCLMELHGGTLELTSELGAGTTVTITFPVERVVDNRQAA